MIKNKNASGQEISSDDGDDDHFQNCHTSWNTQMSRSLLRKGGDLTAEHEKCIVLKVIVGIFN